MLHLLTTIASLSVLLLSIFGVAFAFFTNRQIPYFYCESISAGAFLGIAVFHMIPTFTHYGSQSSKGEYMYSLIFLSGLCFLFFFDLIARNCGTSTSPSEIPMYTVTESATSNATPSGAPPIVVPYIEENGLLLPKSTLGTSIFFLLFSSLASGISIAMAEANHTIIVIALTISFQKFFEITSIGIQLLKMRLSFCLSCTLLIIYSLLTPAISFLAPMIVDFKRTHLKQAFNAGSASVFIFIGTSHWYKIFFCPYEYTLSERVWICMLFFAGLVIIGSTALLWSAQEET
jgi:zinc transporter ZupT